MTKEELIQLSKTSFFDNNVGGISAADHRGFNEALINSVTELTGIDYSLNAEQAVPGEFFVNRQGEKRQVYTRTVVFEYTTQWYSLFSGASLIMSYSLNDLGTALDGAVAARNIPAPEIYVLTNGTVQIVIGAEQLGRYYAIHLKYTKQ